MLLCAPSFAVPNLHCNSVQSVMLLNYVNVKQIEMKPNSTTSVTSMNVMAWGFLKKDYNSCQDW